MCFQRAWKKTDPIAFQEWKTSHVCKLNHSGCTVSMEPVAAKHIWQRWLQKDKLRYTSFYADSKRFSTTKNTHPGSTNQKLECVGHVQKRVDCRL